MMFLRATGGALLYYCILLHSLHLKPPSDTKYPRRRGRTLLCFRVQRHFSPPVSSKALKFLSTVSDRHHTVAYQTPFRYRCSCVDAPLVDHNNQLLIYMPSQLFYRQFYFLHVRQRQSDKLVRVSHYCCRSAVASRRGKVNGRLELCAEADQLPFQSRFLF